MCDRMENLEQKGSESLWLNAALQERRRINFAWLVQALRIPFVVAALVSSGVLLFLRKQSPTSDYTELSPVWLLVMISLFIGAGGIAWWRVQASFLNLEEALLRLDVAHRLDTRLTSARQGQSAWPKFQHLSKSTHWRLSQVLPFFLLSFVLVVGVLFLPIRANTEESIGFPPPSAWGTLASKLELLEEQDLVDDEYIEEAKKQLEDLKAQAPEDWFSHSSLEATDYLSHSHEGAAAQAQQQLEKIDRSLDALQNAYEGMQPSTRQQLLNEFDNALEGLKNGGLRPNKELLDKLSEIDPSMLQQISPEQLEALRGNLSHLQEQLQTQFTNGAESSHGAEGDSLGEENNGLGDGQSGRGKGGLGRGPGSNNDLFGDSSQRLDSDKFEQLQSQDLSHSPPGDLLETFDGQHETEEAPTQDSVGGGANRGDGGDRIWEHSLLPDERRTLKQFFK